ncbi:hypothetical protein [Erythrobacter sp. THAF29]|uniref:hypothetical protein n=1 Tax=Erythrobacter sp. THAF29 TaxID=2587851 RepID=UPI001267CCCF|nr:hypothetical protein [Erythrobacter sp. THAF29]QFT76461.1 hypothetical protein FIU90_02785 [Erythrobacter sp. THAF29]
MTDFTVSNSPLLPGQRGRPDTPPIARVLLALSIFLAFVLAAPLAAAAPIEEAALTGTEHQSDFESGIETGVKAGFESGLESLGREVADEELSDMRGKFIKADSVHYFGVEMVQSWTNADGLTMQATLQFSVDFANGASNLEGATPSIQISWSRVCDECLDTDMDVADLSAVGDTPTLLEVGRFETLEGLVQTQEIAGSDNRVLNKMHFSVVPASSIDSTIPEGSQSVLPGVSQIVDGDDQIQFQVARNELGISMSRGDESVQQGVSGEMSQVAQHVILQSSLNTIRNEMAITVGVNDLATMRTHNIQSALSVMKGRGF